MILFLFLFADILDGACELKDAGLMDLSQLDLDNNMEHTQNQFLQVQGNNRYGNERTPSVGTHSNTCG